MWTGRRRRERGHDVPDDLQRVFVVFSEALEKSMLSCDSSDSDSVPKLSSADTSSITAEIVTVDGSLVQKLAFNRHPGFVRVVR